jgi:hypothetical protein
MDSKIYPEEEALKFVDDVLRDTSINKKDKYLKIRNFCIHNINQPSIKQKVVDRCTIFDYNQKKNLLSLKTGLGRGGRYGGGNDNDDIIYGHTGQYMGHGEWDTPSGMEECDE